MKALYPVILAVPEQDRDLPLMQRSAYLSRHARKALLMSAEWSGVVLGNLEKDPDGVPLPSNGVHWSLTHKPAYVGGVVSGEPVGLDVEEIRPCNTGLFKKVAGEAEWALSNADEFVTFFRYWTAKEALIKLKGTGIRDMLKCRVAGISDDRHLTLLFNGRRYNVEHEYFSGHIASVISEDLPVYWRIV